MPKVIHLDENGTSGGSGGVNYLGLYNDYDALVLANPTAEFGELAATENSQGISWLPGTIGGTYYPQGTYVWNGTEWESNNNLTAAELQVLNDSVDALELEQYKIKARTSDLVPNFLESKISDSTDIKKLITPPAPGGDEKVPLVLQDKNKPVFATVDPTVDDDISVSNAHRVGQWWVNTVSEDVFIAISLVTGAAVWRKEFNRLEFDNHRLTIQEHQDVDSPILIADKSFLRWNGSEWVEHRPYYNSLVASLSRVGQTTIGLINNQIGYETYLSMPVNLRETDNYKISGNFEWALDNTGVDFIHRIRVMNGGVQVYSTSEYRIEPKESAGAATTLNVLQNGVIAGNNTTGTNQIYTTSFDFDLVLNYGLNYTIEIDWQPQTNGVEATIYTAQISCEQKTKTI